LSAGKGAETRAAPDARLMRAMHGAGAVQRGRLTAHGTTVAILAIWRAIAQPIFSSVRE